MPGHFICYSPTTSLDFALKLHDALVAGPPSYEVWLDKYDLKPGDSWARQVSEAIGKCDTLIFLMTTDSVEDESVCTEEWTRALSNKKPIIPLKLELDAELPFRLGGRQYIDFTEGFDVGLAKLRQHLNWLPSPAGALQAMEDRLRDARRDLRRADEKSQRAARIRDEIGLLEQQIAAQQKVVDNPEAEAQRVEERVARGLELERQPAQPVSGIKRSKFINPPPAKAPGYFQNRHVETGLIGEFLEDEAQRLVTVVGRGGTGKTAMACRLLKSLEGGQLPDDGGPLEVEGIVYLSANGSRRVTTPNLYADLSKLLPDETAARLDELYKNPHVSTAAKMNSLLSNFQQGRTVLLLDNFEDLIDPETFNIRDAELDEALCALLEAPQHTVKVILTTRIAPRDLSLLQPGRQTRIDLDDGLGSPYAENILREMDADGKVGLRDAPAALLDEARQRTRGYPRALEALFAILSVDRDTTLRDILNDTANMLPENVVKDLVGEAFNRLDPAAQQVMQALAVYRHPVTPAAVDYLLQPYLPGVNSAPILKRLVNMQFARSESQRYFLHPVDRAYAFSRIAEGQPTDRAAETSPYTQFALLHRAAEYFKQARLPREDWKTIADLAPLLAEFDLRCEGKDYDTAGWVLLAIDFEYLFTWGFYRQMVELHERLVGNISDPDLAGISIGNLATAYRSTGQARKAITLYKQALELARMAGNRQGEGAWLGNLGLCYSSLGKTTRAISYLEQGLAINREVGDRTGEANQLGNLGNRYMELGETARAIAYHEEALAIDREIGNRRGEGADFGNLGGCYSSLGQTARAIEYYKRALAIACEMSDRQSEETWLNNLGNSYLSLGQIARAIEYYERALDIARGIGDRQGEGSSLGNLSEALIDQKRYAEAKEHALESVLIAEEISSPSLSSYGNGHLALACFYAGDLSGARSAAEAARQHDEPSNNDFILALLGLLAWKQEDTLAAREAFTAAVAQAELLLLNNAQNYKALDSKGLALCGLAVCGDAGRVAGAVEAYKAARAENKDVGIVSNVLRLFDALAETDKAGVLAGVRKAAAGED